MRIFVAGASGQVALSLKEAVQGSEITLVTAGRPDFDLTKPKSVRKAITAFEPTAIVNAAAYTAVDAAETDEAAANAVNGDGAGVLAQIADELGVPFIHISTDYVFSGNKNGAYAEKDSVAPTGAYGRSKLAGELAVLIKNPNSIILRTAWVYSPFGKNFCRTMLSLAKDRDALGVVSDQTGNPTYAPDIADAILHILEGIEDNGWHDHYAGTYHLAGTGESDWFSFASEIFRVGGTLGHPVPTLNKLTTEEYPTPAKRPANSCLDCRKIESAFGITMPPWHRSTAACVKRILAEVDKSEEPLG
ncbi:MAG: dTDP-4-dehydrorhamnose reductase [Kordiimonadaceae bacterium]|nr:dTDP-4-dehydrorhamnose reductase [Kordiimonadaceae bacterium]